MDKENALEECRNYCLRHEQEYEGMTDKQKNWNSVCFGHFGLLSTGEKNPEEKLDGYFGRTQIESVFKTSKEYLNLLSLSK